MKIKKELFQELEKRDLLVRNEVLIACCRNSPYWSLKSVMIVLCLLFVNFIAYAQISNTTRNYIERTALNIVGDFIAIGNTNMQCVGCAAGTQSNNPGANMIYVDIDGIGTTQNSSSSFLTIPAGATVQWAGLYWGGVYSSSYGGITNPTGMTVDQVQFMEPGAAGYAAINATTRNLETAQFSGWNTFMSFAEVTTIVQNAGSGNYFAADINLATGGSFTGPHGGWTLVVVYSDPTEQSRRINVWDGFRFFGFGSSDSFNVTGILTPSLGAFETKVAYYGMDGELNQIGDFININGSPLFNASNPSNNVFNGTNSVFGVNNANRNPNISPYNWGYDLDIFNAAGYVPNAATSVGIQLGSTNEGVWGGVFVISNEIVLPTVTKSFSDPGITRIGDVSTVILTIDNPTRGISMTGASITDNLPSGIVIAPTPNALVSCGGTITAIPGADTFTVSGISIPVNTTCTITFDVVGTELGVYSNIVDNSVFSNNEGVDLQNSATAILKVGEDTDGDGTINIFDLDDDNDGISDTQELCETDPLPGGTLNTHIFSISIPASNVFSCTASDPNNDDDGDGLFNYEDPDFCTLNANGVCSSLDSDGDGVINSMDLDSDNDGIFDILEGGALFISGINDTDQNGVIDGAEINANVGNNGLFDAIETTAESGILNFVIQNSDGTDTRDFLDLDADNDGCNDVLEAGFSDGNNDGILGPLLIAINNNGLIVSGLGGYSVPADGDVNLIYDFMELGALPIIVDDVVSISSCDGDDAIFSVNVTGENLIYQWQISVDDGSNFSDLIDGGIYLGTDSATLDISPITEALNKHQYRVVVRNSAFICGEVISSSGILTVPDVSYTVFGIDPATCSGNNGYLIFNGLATSTNYSVVYVDNGVPVGPTNMTSNASGQIVISGLTSGNYSGIIASLNGCAGPSLSEILNDPNNPLPPTSGGDITACEMNPMQTLTATVSAPVGASVRWYSASSGGSLVANPVISNVGSIIYYAESYNPTTQCVSNTRTAITLTIIPTADAGDDGSLTVCEGIIPTDAQLFAQLGGTPDGGGTWSNIGFDFTYTVSPNAPCTENDTAVVIVTEQSLANAGIDGSLQLCIDEMATFGQLNAAITGEETGGTWTPVLAPGIIVYTYTVSSTVPCVGNSTSTVNITIVNCDADLSLHKTVNNSTPDVGDLITFTITLRNDGPSTATNIIVQDIIPSDFTYGHPNFATSQGVVINNVGTGALTWNLGAFVLNVGGSLTLAYTVTVDVCGEFKNQVEIIQSSQIDSDSTPNNGR